MCRRVRETPWRRGEIMSQPKGTEYPCLPKHCELRLGENKDPAVRSSEAQNLSIKPPVLYFQRGKKTTCRTTHCPHASSGQTGSLFLLG